MGRPSARNDIEPAYRFDITRTHRSKVKRCLRRPERGTSDPSTVKGLGPGNGRSPSLRRRLLRRSGWTHHLFKKVRSGVCDRTIELCSRATNLQNPVAAVTSLCVLCAPARLGLCFFPHILLVGLVSALGEAAIKKKSSNEA